MSGHNYRHYGVPDSTVTFGERFTCEGSSGGPRLTIGLDGPVTVSVAVDCDTDVRIVSRQVRLELGDLTFKWSDQSEAFVHIEPDPNRRYVAYWLVRLYNVVAEWLDQPMCFVGYNAYACEGDAARRPEEWLAIHEALMERARSWAVPNAVLIQLQLDREKLAAEVGKAPQ